MSSDQAATLKGKRRLVIAGGGPAGLMAAGTAAARGAAVILLEKTGATGRKLSISDKGRRILTNGASLEQFIEAYGPNGRFLRQAFMKFFNSDLAALCQNLDIPVELDPGGRFVPAGNNVAGLARALHNWAGEQGASIQVDSRVNSILTENGRVTGASLGDNRTIPADAVIVATGGLAYPDTGCTGDGYEWARSLGHTIVSPRPSLVPLEIRGDIAERLEGLSLRDAGVSLLADQKPVAEMIGDLVFTSYGLSGPVILEMSRLAVDCLQASRETQLSIDLMPSRDERALEAHLVSCFKELGRMKLLTILKDMLPDRIATLALELNELSDNLQGAQVTAAERRKIRHWLKDFRLDVCGHRSFDEAMVTAGGIDLREVDPQTLQSRLVKGLFFAGEILDLDGPLGGYNLQAAFSTGSLAGWSAAKPE